MFNEGILTETVNFEELHECFELNMQNMLNNYGIENSRDFFDLWFDVLQNTWNLQCALSKTKNNGFTKSLHFNTFKICLTFNVDVAMQITQNSVVEDIAIDEFADGTLEDFDVATIDYSMTPVTTGLSLNAPIIVAPFPVENRKFLVIDGNHRISYAKHRHISHIKGIFMQMPSVARCLEIPFQKAYYMFIYETYICRQLPLYGITHFDLSQSCANLFVNDRQK